MTSGRVKLDIADGIASVMLDRPEKLNAVTPAMASDLVRMCRELDADPTVRVMLLSGTGSKGFCAGTDLNGLAEYKTAWDYRNRVEYSAAVRTMRKPVVVALFGWALGGGAELALSADLRIADDTAKFSFPEVKNGWVPGGGGTQLLPRLIGYGQAMRMLLTGDVVNASEALRLGLVEEVTAAGEAIARAQAVCVQLAALKPLAVEATKAAVRAALSLPLETGSSYENELSSLCFTGQHMEGIDAFRQRRDKSS
ncbi:MAG: enoyl-CoA hydratase/isomerase family protein [Aestuariivirga sp.]